MSKGFNVKDLQSLVEDFKGYGVDFKGVCMDYNSIEVHLQFLYRRDDIEHETIIRRMKTKYEANYGHLKSFKESQSRKT